MTDHHLTLRTNAAEATKDKWLGTPLKLGHTDCVRMAADHLRRLGHKVSVPAKGSYAGLVGARREMKKRGLANIGDALAALGLEEIAPASTLAGDIIEMQGVDDGLPALVIALGNGRVLGWHDDGALGVVVFPWLSAIRAWRAMPKGY